MVFNYKSSKKENVNLYLLQGELIDRGQAIGLLEEIYGEIENNSNKISLNLADLKYINSSGLNVIINILTRARKSGGDVAICNVNKKINELLVITKLNSIFNMCNSEDETIAILTK